MYQRRGYQSVLKDTLKTDDGEEGDLFWLFMDPGQKSKE